MGWAERDWADDGLDENDDRIFQAGSVPRVSVMEGNQKAILDDLARISNPQPDIIYGECFPQLFDQLVKKDES